jgi:hypothetical protein
MYHLSFKFDDFFETVQDAKLLPLSKWQRLAGFVTSPISKSEPSQVNQMDFPMSRSPEYVLMTPPTVFPSKDVRQEPTQRADHDYGDALSSDKQQAE